MKFKFLGTAAAEGVPGLFCDCELCEKVRKLGGRNIRTRSQALVNDDLLIDFPADTYLHVLYNGLKLHKIQHCIITHDHHDHFSPDDFLMRAPGFSNIPNDIPFNVYGSETVTKRLKSSRIIRDMENIHGCFKVHEIHAFESFFAAGYKITPLIADHSAENSLIYIIEKNSKTILYAHDTGIFPAKTWEWIETNCPKIDLATFDCCYGEQECRENHMGFNAVCEVRDRLLTAGAISEKSLCFINHFSHNAGPVYDDMNKLSLKHGIETAYDGLETEF